jgi:hypothetical protein
VHGEHVVMVEKDGRRICQGSLNARVDAARLDVAL